MVEALEIKNKRKQSFDKQVTQIDYFKQKNFGGDRIDFDNIF